MRKANILFCALVLVAVLSVVSIAEDGAQVVDQGAVVEQQPPAAAQPEQALMQEEPTTAAAGEAQAEAQMEVTTSVSVQEPTITGTGNVTLDFKEADIQNVLKIISFKSGINIVTTPDVIGNISIRLVDVPWETALDVILKTYGFGFQRQGNIILVTKMENISKIQAEEPLQTEIFTLKFLDAVDAQKVLIPMLSPRGKISVLYSRGQKGWSFGTFQIGRETTTGGGLAKEKESPAKMETVSYEKSASGDVITKRAEFEPSIKSKILIVTDTAASLDRLRNVILPVIDKKPRQVLIETKILEVNDKVLKDLGLDWGLGGAGAATSTAIQFDKLTSTGSYKLGGHGGDIGSAAVPSLFAPATTTLTGYSPYNAGAQLVFQKLTGFKFEAVLHALEDDARTNTLSAPSVLTLDNQEAAILVGYHTPILESTVSAGTDTQGTTVTQTLDYYQEIGIRLNVVPQVSDEGFINMIIHPSITSSSSSVTSTSQVGTSSPVTTSYPVIDVRETQTQVLLKDGETVAIGGLLKDVKNKEVIGIPFLKDIPWGIGKLFGRETTNVQKVDLLIFITAKVIDEADYSAEEIAKLEKRFGRVKDDSFKESADELKKQLKVKPQAKE